MSAITSSATGKDGKKKRKREKPKLVRARRRTIDPTKWDSQHLKGVFLDSIVVADDDDHLPVTAPSQPHASGDQEESDLSSSEEGGDESDCSKPGHIAEGSPATSESADGPGYIARTNRDAVDAEHDFNQEKLCTLSLLDSIFGGLEGDQEWGGREALDSDVDMPEIPPVQTSPSSEPSPPKEAFEEPGLIPAAKEVQGDSGSEDSSAGTSTPVPEHTPVSVVTQNANMKAKLKDLFAPQEEQGGLPFTRYL